MGDRYTITERVDSGGMAEVFRGVAESLHGFKKSVAIKRILPSLTKNKKFVSMFLDEARLSLHLQHANVVHVFDIGVADKAYFIVMEYVDGCNLKHVLEHQRKYNRRIPPAQTLYVMLEVCKGLAYAHAAEDPESGRPLGIVHRDISPPNILLSKMGEVKLVDFGLAKATSQLSQIETTDPGVVKGKFSYLSPEAASAQEVDHRADIFAVGILLWEMLTGKRLFYGDTDYQTVEMVRQAKIPSVRGLNPEVDKDLEAVVMKALARDPRSRFQSGADLQDALAQILFSRAMKVTSRDIANMVREVVAERDAGKVKSTGPQKSLIDSLIQEEMGKFTSLEEGQEIGSGPRGVAEAIHEPETSGQSPLDPRAFAADNVPAPMASEKSGGRSGPHATSTTTTGRKGDKRQSATAPATPTAKQRRREEPRAPSVPTPEIGSLSQMLEPDRGITSKKPLAQPVRRGPGRLIVIAVVLLGLIGGGMFIFKDQIFGPPAPSAPAKP